MSFILFPISLSTLLYIYLCIKILFVTGPSTLTIVTLVIAVVALIFVVLTLILVMCRLTSTKVSSQQLAQAIANLSTLESAGVLNRGFSQEPLTKYGPLPGYQNLESNNRGREHPYTEISRYIDIIPSGAGYVDITSGGDDYIDPVQAHPTVNTRT